jgi:hypothetical protein
MALKLGTTASSSNASIATRASKGINIAQTLDNTKAFGDTSTARH